MKVTVESCLKKVDNRFKLVLMAAKRAKDLDRGARPAVAREDDKSTIIAMREISEEAISLANLEEITRSNIVNTNNEMQIDDEEEFEDNDTEVNDTDDELDNNDISDEDDEIIEEDSDIADEDEYIDEIDNKEDIDK